MEYFAGLDVSLGKMYICVLDRDGTVVREVIAPTSPEAIATALTEAPACTRVVFETGRMAPMLYYGLAALGVPVVCVENRQAYQALRTLTTHKTDRSDARGLARLARTGFFKPVHVKSLPAHAVRALILARKKLVGQRVTLENQIHGLAVAFDVRLPRRLSPGFVEQVVAMSDGVVGLSAAMRGLLAAREAVRSAVATIDLDMKRLVRASDACRRLMSIPGVGQLTALAFTAAVDDPDRFRRSRDLGAYLGLVPRRHQSGEVDYAGRISKAGDQRVRTLWLRGCQRHTHPVQARAEAEGLGPGHRQAINPEQGAGRACPPPRHHHARHAPARHRVPPGLTFGRTKIVRVQNRRLRPKLPGGSHARGREQKMARIL